MYFLLKRFWILDTEYSILATSLLYVAVFDVSERISRILFAALDDDIKLAILRENFSYMLLRKANNISANRSVHKI